MLHFRIFMMFLLCIWGKGLQSQSKENLLLETDISFNTLGHNKLELKISRGMVYGFAHAGFFSLTKSRESGFLFPFGGIMTSSDVKKLSYKGKRYGAGVGLKLVNDRPLRFLLSTGIDFTRLTHKAEMSSSDFYLGVFPPYFKSSYQSASGELETTQLFWNTCITAHVHVKCFFLDLSLGYDHALSDTPKIHVMPNASTSPTSYYSDTYVKPLTHEGRLYLAIGAGFELKL